MAEGKIKWFNVKKRYGFIERDDDADAFLHISEWKGPGNPNQGQRVVFEVVQESRGPAAKNVRPAGAKPAGKSHRGAARAGRPGSHRFLNPYNFVRFLPKQRPSNRILGDCPPPPHDRYVEGLLTGRVTCTITTETPLFVSDSHEVKTGGDNHKTYRFFEYDGEPAIPASSLRGMVRSVFETVTNSCMTVFDGDRKLQYRAEPRYGNKVKENAGIIHRLAQPETDDHPAIEGEIKLCQVGKVGAYYGGRDSWKNVLGTKANGKPWKCGDRVVARARKRRNDWLVLEVAETREGLAPLKGNETYVEGWLKITGRGEDTNKRSEALFLDPAIHEGDGTVRFSHDVQTEYNAVLTSQIEEDQLPAEPQSKRLSIGDLVWVDKPRGSHQARQIVRVQVPRLPYDQSIGELVPQHLHRCKEYDALCPACRAFGWVRDVKSGEKLASDVRTAYAGRVRLSHATAVLGKVWQRDEPIPLSILSTPKPTTTQFYLLKGNQPDGYVTYDKSKARLRGRKVYRHHGEEPSQHQTGYEYRRIDGAQDDQNRTVQGVVEKGSEFTFELEFENLHPLELGALLWALDLKEEMVHRLGYGKPLGFGSVTVNITNASLMRPERRYLDLTSNGWETPKNLTAFVSAYQAVFEESMHVLYGKAFDGLVEELRALLGSPALSAVHYPRPTPQPQPDGKNFEWFVGNKRKHGPHIPLPLATEDTEGLPLIDRSGKIV
jgi:CRISPR-associated protein (TIGR03986 family)